MVLKLWRAEKIATTINGYVQFVYTLHHQSRDGQWTCAIHTHGIYSTPYYIIVDVIRNSLYLIQWHGFGIISTVMLVWMQHLKWMYSYFMLFTLRLCMYKFLYVRAFVRIVCTNPCYKFGHCTVRHSIQVYGWSWCCCCCCWHNLHMHWKEIR